MATKSYHKESCSKRIDVDMYVNKIVDDEPHLARVREISADGLLLFKLLEPDVAQQRYIGLEMMLPESEEIIWAVGEVVAVEQRGHCLAESVRFVRISDSDRELIRHYVDTRWGNEVPVAA